MPRARAWARGDEEPEPRLPSLLIVPGLGDRHRAGGHRAAGSVRIYFAGAIRGGRSDAALYAGLVRYLGRFGEVLTAHVGDETLLAEERFLTEGQIFRRDMEWLQAADLVVAEVSTPSLGVGFEIAQALDLGKRVICLHRVDANCPLSAMIAGNPALSLHSYADLDAATRLLDRIFDLAAEGES